MSASCLAISHKQHTCHCMSSRRHAKGFAVEAVQVEDDEGKAAFAVLGLASSSASAADVRTAYRRSARQWHPDKWSCASE